MAFLWEFVLVGIRMIKYVQVGEYKYNIHIMRKQKNSPAITLSAWFMRFLVVEMYKT